MRRYWVMGRKRAVLLAAQLLLYIAAAALGLLEMGKAALAAAPIRELPIYSVETQEKTASVTINCAWDENNLPQLLETLEQEKVRATFFLVGQWAEQYPQLAGEIAAAGHEIGNHSYSHPDFRKLDDEEIIGQLQKTDSLIWAATGRRPALVRTPSGDYDDRVIRLIRSCGYEVIQWDVDSRDWMDPSSEEITERVMSQLQPGSILLFHAGKSNTEEALPRILSRMKAEGYRFIPVGELIHPGEYTLDIAGRQHPQR
ncbi:MAG: polysaccharide deacetylase family protein [Oscillospiraceae bacterium]|nr:polysaccharide deacetylase family protein [Oscillospiraceae bacterium]